MVAIFPITYHQETVSISPKDWAKLWYFLWPAIIAWAFYLITDSQKIFVLRFYFCTAIFLCLIGVGQIFTGWPRPQGNPYLLGYYQPSLFLGHHLSLSNIFIFPFFLGLQLTIQSWKKIRPSMLAFAALSLLVGLFILLMGYSRALWLSLPMGFTTMLFLEAKKTWRLPGLIAVATILGILYQVPEFQERLFSQMGRNDRIEMWERGIALWKTRPWTGIGFGKTLEVIRIYLLETQPGAKDYFIGHMHNLYLEMGVTLGLIGFPAFVAFLYEMGRRLWRQSGLFSAYVVFLFGGLTQVNLWEGKVMHQVCIALALSTLNFKSDIIQKN
jgi:O-antigen ligase